MSKYTESFMQDHNLEEGEEFNVRLNNGKLDRYDPYHFANGELFDIDDDERETMLGNLITENYTVEKLPFAPRGNEKFFYVDPIESRGYDYGFTNNDDTEMFLSRGVIPYRTEKEVIAKVKELGWH